MELEILHFTPISEAETPSTVAKFWAQRTPEMLGLGFFPVGDYRVRKRHFHFAKNFQNPERTIIGQFSVLRMLTSFKSAIKAGLIGAATGLPLISQSPLTAIQIGSFGSIVGIASSILPNRVTFKEGSFITLLDSGHFLETGHNGANEDDGYFHLRGAPTKNLAGMLAFHQKAIEELCNKYGGAPMVIEPHRTPRIDIYGHRLMYARYVRTGMFGRDPYDSVTTLYDGTEWFDKTPLPKA